MDRGGVPIILGKAVLGQGGRPFGFRERLCLVAKLLPFLYSAPFVGSSPRKRCVQAATGTHLEFTIARGSGVLTRRLWKSAVVSCTAWAGITCAWGQSPFPVRPDPYVPAQQQQPPTYAPPNYAPTAAPPNYSPAAGNFNGPNPPPNPNFNAAPQYNPGYPQVATVPPGTAGLPTGPQQVGPPATAQSQMTRFEPGKIVAVVGDQYILAGEALPLVEQMMEPFYKKVSSPLEKQALDDQRPILEEQVVRQLVDTKLMYLEFERNVPKDKLAEVEKKVRASFESDVDEGRAKIAALNGDPKKIQEYVRRDPSVLRLALMMEEGQLQTYGQLNLALKEYGSSLEQQIRMYGEQRLGRSMLGKEISVNPEITHDQLLKYYEEHIAEYEFPAQVKWEVMMVRKDNFPSRDEAFRAMAAMGNEVFYGAQFAAVAKRSSQGFNAAEGGVQDWTKKDALASKVLDQAIFSLPEGKLSQILEDERGLYIVRVLERKAAGRVPFSEVQTECREKIRNDKREEQFKGYLDKLRKKTPVWTIYDKDQKVNPNGPGPQ